MKARIFSIVVLLVVIACSKSSDPAKTSGGCSVSFKGTTYTLTSVICVDATNSGGTNVDGLTAVDAGGTRALSIARDIDDNTGSTVSFATNANDSGTFYYINESISGAAPTITRSGKSWTFSGTAQNSDGDTGALSGTCTCTN